MAKKKKKKKKSIDGSNPSGANLREFNEIDGSGNCLPKFPRDRTRKWGYGKIVRVRSTQDEMRTGKDEEER